METLCVIGEQIGDTLVLPIVQDTVEVVHIIPQEHLQQRTVDQELIIAGETTRNIEEFHSVLEQVKIQETERIQEQIVPERIEVQTVDILVPSIGKEVEPVFENSAPAPSVTSDEKFSPACAMDTVTTGVSSDTTDLVNTQCSSTAVEAVETIRRAMSMHTIVQTRSSRRQLQVCSKTLLHEKQRQVDHCVRVLKGEKENMRVLEECAVVPPHELQSQRSHIQSGKDAMTDAVRDLYECHPQLKRRR